MGLDAACFEHFLEAHGVLYDIRSVPGDVGNSEKFAEFADNAIFVGQAVGANFFDNVLWWRRDMSCFELAADGELGERRNGVYRNGEEE